MKPKSGNLIWASFFIFSGVLLVSIGIWFYFSSPLQKSSIRFYLEKGKATVRTPSGDERDILDQWSLLEGDSVILNDISTGTVTLPAGQARIRLLENSQVIFLRPSGKWLIKLLKGDIEILDEEGLEEVFLQDPDGNIFSLKEKRSQHLKDKNVERNADALDYHPQVLDHQDVDRAYQKLRPQLFKCYSKWRQEDNQMEFQTPIRIQFKITYKKPGVSSLQVQSNQNIPPSLEECLRLSLQQLRLPKYRGSEIDIELPLILE